jgi:hypothetical protein
MPVMDTPKKAKAIRTGKPGDRFDNTTSLS